MSLNTIPKNVDCIILGTGLTNSILAAACSRIGKTVLHIDKNNYYGDQWASFTFQQLLDWIRVNHPTERECLQSVPEELLNKSRMFCIDLCPTLLSSIGPMVNLLVKSNVTRYHDFKNNIRILSMVNNEIHSIPCQRSEVFTSPILSDLIDKRKLMKLIELCIEFDPEANTPEDSDIIINGDKPIIQFLEKRGLNHTIRQYIINSIAMVEPTESTRKACVNIKNFMEATQRFGRSPYLFPMYGCGEFPQSFCRLSAVFGGVYCLNTHVESVKISSKSSDNDSKTSSNDNFEVQLSDDEHKITSDLLVIDYSSAIGLNLTDLDLETSTDEQLARAILITKSSVLAPNNEQSTSFMRIPPSERNPNVVYLLEFNSTVLVCPPNINLVYLWTKASSNCVSASEDLAPIMESIFGSRDENEADKVLWEFYYYQTTGTDELLIRKGEIPGLYITSPPCDNIDYEHSITEAEEIFKKMCPGEEFLPRAPDPEEIIS